MKTKIGLKHIFKDKLIVDILTYFLGKLIPGLGSFVIIPLITNLFGIDIYGRYSIILTTVLLLNAGIVGWVNQSFTRHYSLIQQNNKTNFKIFNTQFLLIVVILLTIISLPAVYFFKLDIVIYITAALLFFIITIYSYNTNYYKTISRPTKIAIADSIRTIIILGLLIAGGLILRKEYSDRQEVIILLSINIMGFLIGLNIIPILNRSELKLFLSKFFFNKNYLKQLIRYGSPLALWFIFSYLLNVSDRYVIKHYLSYHEVGIYSSIYDLVYKIINFIYTPILFAMTPLTFKYFNKGEIKRSKKLINRVIIIYFCLFLILFIIINLSRKFIVINLLNIDSIGALKLINPILIGAFIWNLSMIIHKKYEIAKKTLIMLYFIIIGFSVNLIGNIIFIPKYGIIAAAYSTIAGFGVYLLMLLLAQFKLTQRSV